MSLANEKGEKNDFLIPSLAIGVVAIICAVALVAIAVMGPAMLGVIHYKTSQSGIWQTQAFDVTDLVLLAPLLFIGGVLELMKKNYAKFFLVLTPITLMYVGLVYGVGNEWGSATYSGNSEAYSGLFLTLIIGGVILLIGSLSKFTLADAPEFKVKRLRLYVAVMALFLVLFAGMWGSQLLQVISTGNTSTGDYVAAPTAWWLTRFLDLGFTIPIGFLALLLFLSKPKKAYSLILLFFGFFITLATSVNAIAVVEVVNKDPAVSGSGAGELVIFPVLGILAYAGFFYLIKDKLRRR